MIRLRGLPRLISATYSRENWGRTARVWEAQRPGKPYKSFDTCLQHAHLVQNSFLTPSMVAKPLTPMWGAPGTSVSSSLMTVPGADCTIARPGADEQLVSADRCARGGLLVRGQATGMPQHMGQLHGQQPTRNHYQTLQVEEVADGDGDFASHRGRQLNHRQQAFNSIHPPG